MKNQLTLRQIMAEQRHLRAEANKAVRRQYPLGSVVCWEHGAYKRIGKVVDHGYDTTVFVETQHSKRQRVDAEKFLGDGSAFKS